LWAVELAADPHVDVILGDDGRLEFWQVVAIAHGSLVELALACQHLLDLLHGVLGHVDLPPLVLLHHGLNDGMFLLNMNYIYN
ncbi:MAG: hypothetical protein ACK56F_02955, partial [bacterium]